MASVFALTSCDFELGGTETWEYSADNMESAIELYNIFFKGTAEEKNQIVTFKSDKSVIFVENIDGTSEYIEYTSGAKTSVITLTFTYGDAKVTIPDISDWSRQETND